MKKLLLAFLLLPIIGCNSNDEVKPTCQCDQALFRNDVTNKTFTVRYTEVNCETGIPFKTEYPTLEGYKFVECLDDKNQN